MKNWAMVVALTLSLFLFSTSTVKAQMMGSSSSFDSHAIQEQQAEEQEGRKLLDQLKNKTATCSDLTDSDFEKIGEYFMGQSVNSTQAHISMNERIKSMMGEKGEEQMHIVLGKRASNCSTTSGFTLKTGGGGFPMMGSSFGYTGMMSGAWGFGTLGLITWILIVVNLVLLAIYLWKKIQKNK